MPYLIEQIQSWLVRSGWAVVAYRRVPAAQSYAADHLLTLDSTWEPHGVRVEADVRIYHGYDEWWDEEQLLGVTVRFPPRPGQTGPIPEANLTGEEAQPRNFRQLARVLTWFRDPLSGALWEERPLYGDWMPPAAWEAERWGPQISRAHRWPTTLNALEMLRHLPGQPDERKLQLIACACCRLLPIEMMHERNRLAVDAAERYAEGLIRRREMKKVCKLSDLAWLGKLDPLSLALRAAGAVIEQLPSDGRRLTADLVREVMGDPFHPVVLRHCWLRQEGGVVRHLAQAIAAQGRFDELPILADALEDVGCTDPAVLEHCRGPWPHVRGCWALDLLRPPERKP